MDSLAPCRPTPKSEDDNRVVTLMVNEMFEKADIKKRKADIAIFNQVKATYCSNDFLKGFLLGLRTVYLIRYLSR